MSSRRRVAAWALFLVLILFTCMPAFADSGYCNTSPYGPSYSAAFMWNACREQQAQITAPGSIVTLTQPCTLVSDQPWNGTGRDGVITLGYLYYGNPHGYTYEYFCGLFAAPAPQKAVGEPPCGACVGDPIDTSNGNVYVREEDFNVNRWIKFERFYNSAAVALSDTVGNHWLHTYSRRIMYTPPAAGATATASILRADGHVYSYILTSAGWAGEPDVSESLAWSTDASGAPVSWTVGDPLENVSESYDASGNLVKITGADGLETNLLYSTSSTPPAVAPIPGLLITVRDPQGRSLQLTYNADARLATVASPSTSVAYGYDTGGNLTTVTYAGSNTRSYFYDESTHVSGSSAQSLLTGIQDESGFRATTYDYDAQGRGVGTQLASGIGKYTITYNSDGSATFTDPLGASRNRTFTALNGISYEASISGLCESCGSIASRAYFASGKLSSTVDFNGVTTSYAVDQNLFVQYVTQAQGTSFQRSVQTIYDTTLHVPLTIRTLDAAGNTVKDAAYTYNSRAQATAYCEYDTVNANDSSYLCGSATTVPAGVRQWSYTYCEAVSTSCPLVGLLLGIDGPRTDVNDVTSYSYYTTSSATGCGTPGAACYQAGDIYQVKNALNQVTTYASYDASGRVTRKTDANGTNTDITYSPRGWVLTRTEGGATTAYGRDAVGNVTQLTDPDGVITKYGYDQAYRLIDVTDGMGNRTHYTLDNVGNNVAETIYNASNAVTKSSAQTYNSSNQRTSVVDGLGHTTLNASLADSYDANGNLVHTIDALGVHRKLAYDSLNRLISSTLDFNGSSPATANATLQYGFDARQNLVQVTDPNSLVTNYNLDALGNQLSVTSPDTGLTTAVFDAAGNRTSRTDANSSVLGMTYDALNRPLSMAYSDAELNVALHYDEADSVTGCASSKPVGQVTRIVEVEVTTVYCYDARGNVTKKTQIQGASSSTSTFTYTNADRLETVVYPSGAALTYSRDANGRISSATITPVGGTASTVVSSVTYLPFGPVASYQLGNNQVVTRTYDANYAYTDVVSPVMSIHVARDAAGNIVALGNSHGANPAVETFSYDALYRLTGVFDGSTTTQAFTYNATGDRLSKIGSGISTGDYGYVSGSHHLSSIGNSPRTVDSKGSTTSATIGGESFVFNFSGSNRVASVQAGSQTIGVYVYNMLGERVSKSPAAGGAVQRFMYDQSHQLIGEYGASGREYLWIDDLPVAVVDISGSTSVVSYLHADGLNTPRVVSTANGNAVWQWAFSGNAFGESSPTGSYSFNLRFPGQYFDSETGVIYNLNRYYEAGAGRFISADPAGLTDGPSVYAYARNRPLTYADPLGLWVKICTRELGSPDKPATARDKLFAHQYLNVSGKIFSFQKTDSMLWGPGTVLENEDQNKGCEYECKDRRFDKYVIDAAAKLGEPTYCVVAFRGTAQYEQGARNCQSWAGDVLDMAKGNYLAREKCPDCSKD